MARSFFDTSALVKHYHPDTGTTAVDRLINESGAELLIFRLTLQRFTAALRTAAGVRE